jgi:hypothetical protein
MGLVPLLAAFLSSASPVRGDTLNWQTNRNRVTADIKSARLTRVLEQIASATRWQVFVEPDVTRRVSAKFKDLPSGEALRLLLGDLNFALVPETNASAKLFVFRTQIRNATQLVQPDDPDAGGKIIPNELVIRLKPGMRIEDVARMLGAKVIGRVEGLNAYRLRFEDEAATAAARERLAANPEIASVDNNYTVGRPSPSRELSTPSLTPVQLQLKPPPDNGRIIVGLIDTAVQPLGGNLDSFILKPLSVAGESQLDPDSPSHGTTMAETMLRSLQVMTKGSTSVQILPVDVYGPNASTSTFDVAAGIVQAVNSGAKVINLSLGSEADSPFLHTVIQEVSKQKILIYAAAGNTPVTTPQFPAAYPEVMAVTAVEQGQIAPYANRGGFISVGAPGSSVVYYNGQPYYVVGTSAATAFTSGIAAGYMESTRSGPEKAQAFIQENFGLKRPGGPP